MGDTDINRCDDEGKREVMSGLLARVAADIQPGATTVEDLRRLTGGANQEIWAFAIAGRPFVLRRSPPGAPRPRMALPLSKEAEVLRFAHEGGVPVPAVRHILRGDDGEGEGYVMEFVEGETLGTRIARAERFAGARGRLAYQCGAAIARLHALPVERAPELRRLSAARHVEMAVAGFREDGYPRPVLEYAARWLQRNIPEERRVALVHGDFRNGNIAVLPDGLAAILDWEGASIGDPMQDLAWICVNSWRFGNIHLPVGGFGAREQLYEGYEAGGGTVDRESIHFWDVMGTLRWGVSCVQSLRRFDEGDDTVERAMIARRASETEIDLLQLLAPRG